MHLGKNIFVSFCFQLKSVPVVVVVVVETEDSEEGRFYLESDSLCTLSGALFAIKTQGACAST